MMVYTTNLRVGAIGVGVLSAVMMAGCGGPQGPEEHIGAQRAAGRTLQGRTLQGRTLQGRTLQGTSLAGVTIQGAAVADLALEGTTFVGTIDGQPRRGVDFVGAVFQEVTESGTTTDLVVSDITADPSDPSGEVLLYSLSVRDPVTGSESAACGPDPYGDLRALPLSGTWDESGVFHDTPSTFSIACLSGVLAKCTRWGYKPWATKAGRPLRDYHQACTRMARADYCGDGTSFTQNATLVDIYDDLLIQERAPGETLLFDGAWTPGGAYCISKERWLTLQNLLSLSCQRRFVNLSLLSLETSPVASDDLCLLKQQGLSRSEVHMDNRSDVNISITLP